MNCGVRGVVPSSVAVRSQEAVTMMWIALAGMMGAAGVILAALAAHAAPGAGLDGAAYMLLFHAVAILAASPLLKRPLIPRPILIISLGAWVFGSVVFSGDIGMRALAGHRLFPMAAPIGGFAMIVGWLALAIAAIVASLRK
jgi:uncharacterized membrane protein YgdD (TMEM256/DUF423 family)